MKLASHLHRLRIGVVDVSVSFFEKFFAITKNRLEVVGRARKVIVLDLENNNNYKQLNFHIGKYPKRAKISHCLHNEL